MSLGGYLYKGYSVEKQSGWTDGQWALALHKCRLKAFLDSVERSGAAWVISRTDGDIDLDETHTGCIYPLATNPGDTQNGLYRGYATYFKYQESGSDPAGYYLILTVPRWVISKSDGDGSYNHDGIDIYIDNIYAEYGNPSTYVYVRNATCLHALSLSDFGTHPKEQGYIPDDSTRLTPVGSTIYGSYSSGSAIILESNNNTYIKFDGSNYYSGASFGYATKAGTPDIESFAKSNRTADANWHVTILSPQAITQTINKDDQYKLALFKIYSRCYSGSGEYGEVDGPDGDYGNTSVQFLRSDGTIPSGIFTTYNSYYSGALYNGIPDGSTNAQRCYSAFACYTNNPKGGDLTTKGYINVELAAFSRQPADNWSTVSAGKYLCVGSTSVYRCALGSTGNTTMYLYIGWDSSNVNMASTDACPAYTPVIE